MRCQSRHPTDLQRAKNRRGLDWQMPQMHDWLTNLSSGDAMTTIGGTCESKVIAELEKAGSRALWIHSGFGNYPGLAPTIEI
jgi:2-hydroxychromene-2-carboxylate isomerase